MKDICFLQCNAFTAASFRSSGSHIGRMQRKCGLKYSDVGDKLQCCHKCHEKQSRDDILFHDSGYFYSVYVGLTA